MAPAAWRPSPVEGLEVNEVADGLVIYADATGSVHYLNNTAAAVFVLCTGEHAVDDVIAEVARTFSMATAPAADVVRCLDELIADGLVR